MGTSAQARRAGLRVVTEADAQELAAAGSTSSPLSDERLIEAVESGDHRLAGELYDRLIGVVDHTLYRVFGRREPDHEDLVQAAFEQIVLTLSRQSFARACSLKTWASTVTSHVGFNALRSRRRERAVLDRQVEAEPESAASTADTERQALARAELERMREQLVAMKSEHAHTVFLHDVLGHELAEIALMTDVSVAAAQSRLVRGRKELYRRMGVENSGRRRK
jgi:RNA polymerase sigma-70 factor (ECF subfamily)